MNFLSKIHILLTCLFAPLLIIILISEIDERYDIESNHSLNDTALNILYNINKIKDENRLSTSIVDYNDTKPFEMYATVVTFSLLISTIFGIFAGIFSSGIRISGILALLFGMLAPVLILWYQ